MGLDFVCSWSGSLPVLCPAEPVLVVFSSELISCLSSVLWSQAGDGGSLPSLTSSLQGSHRCRLEPTATDRFTPRAMKKMLLRLQAVICYTNMTVSVSGYSDKHERQT